MTFEPWDDPPLTLAREPEPPPPPKPPRLNRKALVGGIAAACVLGLGLGLAARPELIGVRPKPEPMQPRAATAQGQIDVVMADPAPEPVIPERAPLETMSPELIQAAPKAPMVIPRPRAEPSPSDEQIAMAPDTPPPMRRTRPSFDCGRAQSLAEEMVCSEPALAAADRQLSRAFQRALRAGAPYDMLRSEQDDWLDIREDAARRSPRALAAVYDQRIDELNAMADEPQRNW